MMEEQIFEIIGLEHPEYLERMKAIDKLTEFETLEEIFITDEYITVRMKAFDKLTILYGNTKKYKKMVATWKELTGFNGWVHFIVSELGRGNNIEKTTRWIFEQYGYPFETFWQRYYTPETKNKIVQSVVDVMISPIKNDDRYQSRDGFEVRYTQYGVQYHYEMVIKLLITENNKLSEKYVYVHTWNAHPNTYQMLIEKINYMEE